MPALSTQRYANPKFLGALRYRIGHHAVEPHCSESQGQPGKYAKDPCRQVILLPLRLIGNPGVQILDLIPGLLVWVHC